ncbi:ComEC/Rec2 family competence protein [Psychroserpens sp. MEBiC05023]
MKPLNFIVIKLTGCLSLGILTCHLLSIQSHITFYVTGFTFIIFIVTYILAIDQFQKTIGFGLSAYLLMINIGMLTYTIHNQYNFKNHYTKHISLDQSLLLTFKVKERLKPSLYHKKYITELISIDNQPLRGKFLLNIEIDSLNTTFNVDDVLSAYTKLQTIPEPLNPNQFDYNYYLKKQYIYHQLTIASTTILQLKSDTHTLSGYAASLRNLINRKLNLYHFKASELAIINAMLLGQRQDISKDLYENYVSAGAIHILAISGLHVGIILLILNTLLKPLHHFKQGKLMKVCLIILLLWSFAIVAGLSASVTRAVTMFSIIAIAMHWKRLTNIYNTLAISAFVLLLFKPMFLFDVGFQMSYLAVIAIVTIQPLLYKLWQPKWNIINYFWQLLTVTIAAQLGVVPISLYYFNQFPGLFFVSNLAIIPCLGLILGLGLFIIILALLDLLPEVIAQCYGTMISLMNNIINWVAQKEAFIFKTISFDIEHVFASYLLIMTAVLFWKTQQFKSLLTFLISILIVQGVWIYSAYKHSNNSFVIFHKNRYSILGHKKHLELMVFHNLDSTAKSKDKVITNYTTGNFIETKKEDSIASVYQFQNSIILIIDSLGVYNVNTFYPDYVLLRNSPRINLERMIDSIHPKHIISDGSNYKSYIKRWEATCRKRKLPFHQTGKKGAFIISK